MADMTIKTFDDLVEGQAAAVQGRAAGLLDYSIGSILRAFGEAVAGAGLWLQGLILVLLRTTRLSTCEDADADTFVADFGAAPTSADETLFQRLGAASGTTNVTFGRLSTAGQVVIPAVAGATSTIQTLDGSVKFDVAIDTGNPAYNVGLGGYVMADGIATLSGVPVVAEVAGSASNVVAGALNTIASAIPGISTVTNPAAVTNGADAETTAQMQVRFRNFIAALRRATPQALQFAVESLGRGVVCVIKENTHFDGSTEKGFSTVLVDDGTGSPPTTLLTAAAAAADVVHAAGTSFGVYAPTVVNIDVTAALVSDPTADHSAAVSAAVQALQAYLNTLPIGATVYWSRVWQVLQDSSEDVLEVTGLAVNSGTSDVAMTFTQVAKAHTLSIT